MGCADHLVDKPPCADDWKTGKGITFKAVSHKDSWPGDVISNGTHVGIIEKWGSTISATPANGVTKSDWGFRKEGNDGSVNSCIIRRYHA